MTHVCVWMAVCGIWQGGETRKDFRFGSQGEGYRRTVRSSLPVLATRRLDCCLPHLRHRLKAHAALSLSTDRPVHPKDSKPPEGRQLLSKP